MQHSRLVRIFGLLMLLSVLLWALGAAKEDPQNPSKRKAALAKTTGDPIHQVLNINNFLTWFKSNGDGNNPPSEGGDGGYYPKGTRWVIYEDGMMWRAKAYLDAAHTQQAPGQLIRVGGSSYNTSTAAGWINGTGASATPLDPAADAAKMYRVRRDYMSMSKEEQQADAAEYNEVLTADATQAMIDDIMARYDFDWKNWPVDKGAPYIERNGIPGYQAPPAFSKDFTVDSLIAGKYDEPGVAGSDPNSPADQVMWTVLNDLNEATSQGGWGSDPLGLEIQATIWGYKRSDALGQLYFKRYRVINKGGVYTDLAKTTKGSFYVDSMFVCQWSDPDLGGAGDDLVGCDTLLSIGFVYNGNPIDNEFKKFNLPPPSAAYDFLAGPIVASPGDSAVFDFKIRHDFKNLPMTSFCYFSAGSPISDPPFTYEGALRWYRMLDGFVPDASTAPYRYYPSGPFAPSPFPLSGDPVARTGFIDGLGEDWSLAPGDRRLLLNSGPFELAPGDTQEIVVGTVGGLGSDRLSSVSVMKFNDRFVQNTFNALFAVPKPPLAPDVKIAQLNEEVILEWGSNPQRVKDVEQRVAMPGDYHFEGYNVYQFPSAASTLADAKRIATYDLVTDPAIVLDEVFDVATGLILSKPIQYGSNSGVKREFVFNQDFVRGIGKLYNGTEYFLAVTAYTNSKQEGYSPTALESTPIVYRVVPQSNPPGVTYPLAYGDTLKGVVHTNKAGGALSDGSVIPEVVNPTALTGASYKVVFDTLGGEPVWNLVRTLGSTVETVVKGVTDQAGSDLGSPVVDGIRWRVFGAALSFKRFLVTSNANGLLSPPDIGCFAFNDNGFPTVDGLPADGVNDRPSSRQQVGGGHWGIHTGGSTGNATFSGRFIPRTTRDGANWPFIIPWDWEIRFTAAGGKANTYFTDETTIDVPFELWNIGIGTPDDASDDYRVIPLLNDVNGNHVFDLDGADNNLSGGDNDPETDWIYWYNPVNVAPGHAGYDAVFANGTTDINLVGDEVMARMVLVNWNGGSVGDPTFPANVNQAMPESGTTFRILSTKPNSLNDVFTVTAPAVLYNQAAAANDVGKVGVFPNPYYAFNPQEINRSQKFVTFTKLPARATIRIYNLAGQLVRTIEKNDNTQFLRWNLNNNDNYPVASGMYIVHIDMPDIGATKILKVGIVQEQEVPDVF